MSAPGSNYIATLDDSVRPMEFYEWLEKIAKMVVSHEDYKGLRSHGVKKIALHNLDNGDKDYPIEDCDLEFLKEFPNVESLSLDCNTMIEVPAIKFLYVTEFSATNNYLTSLDFLEHMPNVKRLNVSANNITDIYEITYATKLKEVDLTYNKIVDPRPLRERLCKLDKLAIIQGNPLNPKALKKLIKYLSDYRDLSEESTSVLYELKQGLYNSMETQNLPSDKQNELAIDNNPPTKASIKWIIDCLESKSKRRSNYNQTIESVNNLNKK